MWEYSTFVTWLKDVTKEQIATPLGFAAIAGTAALFLSLYQRQVAKTLVSEIQFKKDLPIPSEYPIYFPREIEQDYICKALKNSISRIIVIVGIPQSGRSKIAIEAIQKSYSYDVTHIDFRESPFDNVSGLEKRFAAFDRADAIDFIAHLVSGISKTLQGELEALETISVKQREEEIEQQSLNQFKETLRRAKYLTLPRDSPHLVLLNHFEALAALSKDLIGLRALEYFMLWLSGLARDKREIKVVITASPLYFYDFMIDQPIRDSLHVVGIGNLSKDETERAYQKFSMQIVKDPTVFNLLPSFEQIYDYFGGRILDIQKFLEQFANSNGASSLEKSPDLGSSVTKFIQALQPQLYSKLPRCKNSYPVIWTREELINSWKLLLNAKNQNYAVPYLDFIKVTKLTTLQAFLRHGLVMFRPQSCTYRDILLNQTTDIITFRKPLDRKAVQIIFEKISSDSFPIEVEEIND